MTFVDWMHVFEQTLPFVGALWFGTWITRDFRRAQIQIAEMAKRCEALEALLTDKNTTDAEVREIGFEPDSAEPLPLPRPLPPAIARYRS